MCAVSLANPLKAVADMLLLLISRKIESQHSSTKLASSSSVRNETVNETF